jgi:hypothetical protein
MMKSICDNGSFVFYCWKSWANLTFISSFNRPAMSIDSVMYVIFAMVIRWTADYLTSNYVRQ